MHSAGTPKRSNRSVIASACRTFDANTIARRPWVCSNHASTGSAASPPSTGAAGAIAEHGTRKPRSVSQRTEGPLTMSSKQSPSGWPSARSGVAVAPRQRDDGYASRKARTVGAMAR
jgi:hypothetical protein